MEKKLQKKETIEDRLNKVMRWFLAIIIAIVAVCTFPIWLLVYILFDFNVVDAVRFIWYE